LVSASNLQAILYMVVKIRFPAPFQYVVFKLPFHIPYQSRALIYTTFCNIATPHTLIAILLSYLQALYNFIILFFIIAINLFSAGVVGVAVTLLRLLREVDEGIESVDRREGVSQGGNSINTLK
jgi:hypothetical protein